MEKVSLLFSAPAFTFLLYENARSNYDQEGFLLGKLNETETKTITDDSQDVINISRVIKINSVIPCPHQNYFANAAGEIDLQKIQDLIGNQESEVMAWYIFKKNVVDGHKFTFRHKLIHKSLMQLVCKESTLFTCCLLNASSTTNGATHMYCQTFIRYSGEQFEQVPMHIPNLGDPNNTYKSSEPSSDVFDKILNSVNLGTNVEGLAAVTKIYSAVQNHVDSLVLEVSKAEKDLFQLEQEVKSLQLNLKVKSDLDCGQSLNEEGIVENGDGDNLCKKSNSKENMLVKGGKTGRGRGRGRKIVNSVNNVGIEKTDTDETTACESLEKRSSISNNKSPVKSNMSYANATQREKH